jgi:8-oxo-dGTP diphosphatase
MGYISFQREVSMSDSRHHVRPSVTVDIVTVARVERQQKVLLIRRKNPPFEGLWALPGGFVEPHEPLEAAARRELREETGVEPAHLEQLHTFGDPGRDPRGWTISVTYLALIDMEGVEASQVRAGSDALDVAWFDLDDPPPLAFDHADILAYAAYRLADHNKEAG